MKTSEEFLNETVRVVVDRPIGSSHPRFPDLIYRLNYGYGYVPETLSGDGEEIDAYILGVDRKEEEFEGKCIALIRRESEKDDKLIVAIGGTDYSDQEIVEATRFQEKFFKSKIIRK